MTGELSGIINQSLYTTFPIKVMGLIGDGMVTGFDLLGHSKAFQEHWVRRFVAMVIDVIIIFLPLWFILAYFHPKHFELILPIASGIVWFLYSGILEGVTGKTIGKSLMNLKVVSITGPNRITKTLIRNVSKIFWYAFLPIDCIIGLATEGDPRQRLLDRVVNTTVMQSPPTVSTQPRSTRLQQVEDKPLKQSKPSQPSKEKCRVCSAPLTIIDENRSQCSKCGLIQ